MNSSLIPSLIIASTASILGFGGTAKSAVEIAKLLFLASALLILAAVLAGRSRDESNHQSHRRGFIPHRLTLIPKLALVIALLTLGSWIHQH